MLHNAQRIGVLVAQLGTPAAPTPAALRPYLKQFLSDRRVIDYPAWLWQPILRGIILQTRPRRSAKLYQRIWTDEGSPLLVYSQRQVEGIQARLGENYRVILGMTYGQPSIQAALDTLQAEGIDRILVFPMYPQYSCTTTASVYDAVYKAAGGNGESRYMPTLRFVPPYYQDARYISSLTNHIREQLAAWGKTPDKIIFSFHGVPNRYIKTGDPYRHQCEITAQRLAGSLDLAPDAWLTSFQSQFGPEKWLEPYTEHVLTELPSKGVNSVFVVAAGFVADCLETLDELGNEGRAQFVEGGGKAENYYLCPCLNDYDGWLDTMSDITCQESMGWQPETLRVLA